MKLSAHFALKEFTRTSADLPNMPPPAAVSALITLCDRVLEPVRALLGVPLRVNSGYRSDAVNAAIGGAAKSQHRHGEAADVIPVDLDAEAAMAMIVQEVKSARLTVDQAIVYRSGFIHLSYTTSRKNRNQLLRSLAGAGSAGPYVPYEAP